MLLFKIILLIEVDEIDIVDTDAVCWENTDIVCLEKSYTCENYKYCSVLPD